MSDAAKHYENLLARHYSWMVGAAFDAKVAEQQALLEEMSVKGEGLALDLGCGPGYQAVALARLGYSPVRAVDGSEALLNELAQNAKDLPVERVHGDIRNLRKFAAPESATWDCWHDSRDVLRRGLNLSAQLYRALNSRGPERPLKGRAEALG